MRVAARKARKGELKKDGEAGTNAVYNSRIASETLEPACICGQASAGWGFEERAGGGAVGVFLFQRSAVEFLGGHARESGGIQEDARLRGGRECSLAEECPLLMLAAARGKRNRLWLASET